MLQLHSLAMSPAVEKTDVEDMSKFSEISQKVSGVKSVCVCVCVWVKKRKKEILN